jgi:outer membrane protein TolC
MMMCCMLGLALGVHAQESVFLQQYREKVKAYNQDIKSAGYAVSIRQEAEKSAKADFLPSLSGNANASYTGNPLELYRELPSIEIPLYFQGRDTKYGASVTLLQPVYSGGALKAGLEKSRKEKESALYEEKRVTNDVLYQADQYYWNKVAKAATSEQLDGRVFFRVNRQFILSADSIRNIQHYFNGKAVVSVWPAYEGTIQISRERMTLLKMWLNS